MTGEKQELEALGVDMRLQLSAEAAVGSREQLIQDLLAIAADYCMPRAQRSRRRGRYRSGLHTRTRQQRLACAWSVFAGWDPQGSCSCWASVSPPLRVAQVSVRARAGIRESGGGLGTTGEVLKSRRLCTQLCSVSCLSASSPLRCVHSSGSAVRTRTRLHSLAPLLLVSDVVDVGPPSFASHTRTPCTLFRRRRCRLRPRARE